MPYNKVVTAADMKKPLNLSSRAFVDNKYAYYHWLRTEAPVFKGKVSIFNVYMVSRYDDCVNVLKDPRFVRNQETAVGKRRFSVPLPKQVELMMSSMINQDDPEHRRLRTLVHKAFTPRRLRHLHNRIETLTHELLDKAEKKGQIDLRTAYALPIPAIVIGEMVGVTEEEMPQFIASMNAVTNGLTGIKIIKTMLWDVPKTNRFIRQLIARKRTNLQDDILSGLIEAEDEGSQLSDDELVSMVFLLITAGYETTVDLITNAVQTLLTHPEALQQLRDDPSLMASAVEEINRFNGPVHGTEMQYASEDIVLHGVTIPRGEIVYPLLGSANHDPDVFENPTVFDITREKNRHLGFGQGIHYCLGAPLARIETTIALRTLLERSPNLKLAIDPDQLKLQAIPILHRYERLPVILG